MDRLRGLESDSIHILRESRNRFRDLGMLWSIGKDSTALLWLARKAFFGHVPFPLVHIDTTYKIPEMIEYRDRLAREWGFRLLVSRNAQALVKGMHPSRGRIECCTALKTEALRSACAEHGLNALILGIRRDEEGSRSKERVFSPRDRDLGWNLRDQPPEFWDQYNTDFPEGSQVRVHPLLAWTELDVWEYIEAERVPVIGLYFNRGGKRYRSIGCAPCTGQIESRASTVAEIIAELRATKTSERAGRAQDQAADYAMQALREKGYM